MGTIFFTGYASDRPFREVVGTGGRTRHGTGCFPTRIACWFLMARRWSPATRTEGNWHHPPKGKSFLSGSPIGTHRQFLPGRTSGSVNLCDPPSLNGRRSDPPGGGSGNGARSCPVSLGVGGGLVRQVDVPLRGGLHGGLPDPSPEGVLGGRGRASRFRDPLWPRGRR